MGKYYLQEIATIDGAVLDNNKYDVDCIQTDTTTKEYVVNLNITNETTLIEVSKQDITGEKELKAATLAIVDENNHIESKKYSLNEKQNEVKYNFNSYGTVDSIVDGYNNWRRQTDSLSRLKKNVIHNDFGQYETIYEYANSKESNKTTTYVSKITNGNKSIEYQYYEDGKLSRKTEDGKTTEYIYDSAGRLKTESNGDLDRNIYYSYDANGNI